MKKSLTIALLFILVLPLVLAQGEKISIETSLEKYEPGEKINVKVSLFDSENKPLNNQVNLVFEDAKKITKIEKIISSNQFIDIDLGDNIPPGDWTITATYQEAKATAQFIIEESETATFELNGDKLIITNTGNTRFVEDIKIIIGNTASDKNIDLNVGKSLTFRLIAPDGNYDIKIIRNGDTEISRSNVALTGNVIGILDESTSRQSGITGGLRPDEESNFSPLKNNLFVYVFVLAVLGAMILLAIERRYKKKAK